MRGGKSAPCRLSQWRRVHQAGHLLLQLDLNNRAEARFVWILVSLRRRTADGDPPPVAENGLGALPGLEIGLDPLDQFRLIDVVVSDVRRERRCLRRAIRS